MLNQDLNDKRDKVEHDISGVSWIIIMFVIMFVFLLILGDAV